MKHFITTVLFLACLIQGYSQADIAFREKNFNLKDHVALQEYDVVSYFSGKPMKGKESLKYEYLGTRYFFSNETNLNAFKTNPSKYEPAYGGWCAYAMGSDGTKVEVDPETFKIVNGKLYLFYNFYFNNTLKKWNSKEAEYKAQADKNWNHLTIK